MKRIRAAAIVGTLLIAGFLWANPAMGQAGSNLTSPAGFTESEIFTSGTMGYHTYRIPSIIATLKGTLLAFCEGRKNSSSDTGDIDMLQKRSTDGGRTWSEQQVIWDDGPNTCGNTCPVVDRLNGTVWLL